MNAQLAAAVQQYPNLEFVDWNAIVAAHPDAVYGDGVHLTPVGQAAMADVVRQRVDAFVAARVAATSTTVPPTTVAPTTVAPSTAPTGDDRGTASRPASGDGDSGGSDTPWIVAAIAAGCGAGRRGRPGHATSCGRAPSSAAEVPRRVGSVLPPLT